MTQKQKILKALNRKKWVSVREMMFMGIAKYTNRISDLRADGYVITNDLKFNRKKKCYVSRYCLEQ